MPTIRRRLVAARLSIAQARSAFLQADDTATLVGLIDAVDAHNAALSLLDERLRDNLPMARKPSYLTATAYNMFRRLTGRG